MSGPNPRLQRTRVRSPLSRKPLGACAIAIVLSASLSTAGCGCLSASVSSVTGTARDTQGTPLPGVTISLMPEVGQAIRTVVSDREGAYTFLGVPRGRYRVVSSFAGFAGPQPSALDVGPAALTRVHPLIFAANPPETIETDKYMMVLVETPTPVAR